MERVHDSSKRISLRNIPLRTFLVDLRIERVEIQPQVDASVGERLHAVFVIGGWINVVNTDAVCANGLHESSVGGALVIVNEGVVWDELVGDSWGLLVHEESIETCIRCSYP
jgi:hypothetical protein